MGKIDKLGKEGCPIKQAVLSMVMKVYEIRIFHEILNIILWQDFCQG